MGLKYNFFIVEADPDELLKNLVAGGAVDKTPLMLALRAWEKQRDTDLKAVMVMTGTPEEKTEKVMKALERPCASPELEEFRKQTHNAEFYGMDIWWMRFPPNPKYIVGGFTSYMFQRHIFMVVASHYLTKFGGLKDIWFINYHHGSNEGSVVKVVRDPAEKDDDDWVVDYPPLPDEAERYEIYAARIDREVGSPAAALHSWISGDAGDVATPWTHEVRFPSQDAKRKI